MVPGDKIKKLTIAIACAGALLMEPGAAFSQSRSGTGSGVDSRIDRIEREIQTLSRAVFRGEQPPPGASLPGQGGGVNAASAAQIELRLSQIESDMRDLTGRVEEMSFQIRQLEQRMEENRQAAGGLFQGQQRRQPPSVFNQAPATGSRTNTPYAAEQNSPQQQGGAQQLGTLRSDSRGNLTAPRASGSDPSAQYDAAFALIRQQDYDAAETAFRSFLDRFPNHSLAANAMYWLGETYYVRGQYESAARVFAEAYQKYPDGNKAPDNLLKMGMSLSGMGSAKDACVAFAQLGKQFPTGAGPILSRAEQEMRRLNCGSL